MKIAYSIYIYMSHQMNKYNANMYTGYKYERLLFLYSITYAKDG